MILIVGATKTETQSSQGIHQGGSPSVATIRIESDSTWTASSGDEQATSQQKDLDENTEVNWEDAVEEGFWIENFSGITNKREMQDSTEDENETIKINTGSFVNSDICRETKKKKPNV